MKMKRFLVTTLLATYLSLSASPFVIYAASNSCAGKDNPTIEELRESSIEDCIYGNDGGVKGWFQKLDIRRTVANSIISMFMTLPGIATGKSVDNLKDCVLDPSCDEIGGDLVNNRRGSLWGLALTLEDTLQQEDLLPVNLAYYMKDVVQRTPLVKNTVYAQTFDYNNFGANYILEVWKVTRNLAYGVLAVVMIVIGIMIMTRKSIDPKTTVTIQNALPKIIIALILITFSYPIGSLAASLVPPLQRIPAAIFNELGQQQRAGSNVFFGVVLENYDEVQPGVNFLRILVVGWQLMGIALPIVIISILAFITYLVMLVMALIKVAVMYFKILVAIILSPLTFAWGAIPGNEKATSDWFKKIVVYVVSIPAMYFLINFAEYMTWVSVSSQSYSSTQEGFIGLMLGPIFVILIMSAALKIPKSLEEAVIGKKR